MSEQLTGLCTSTTMDQQRQKFYHPYSPYEIQLQFMRALYDCIEGGKIGIFESPTGEFHVRQAEILVDGCLITQHRYCMSAS